MPAPTEIMRPTDTVSWKSGLATIKRVTTLAWQTPGMVIIAIGSTIIASGLQLLVPLLLGRAVDQTQTIASNYADAEAATGRPLGNRLARSGGLDRARHLYGLPELF